MWLQDLEVLMQSYLLIDIHVVICTFVHDPARGSVGRAVHNGD